MPVWSPDSQTRTFVRIDWALDLPPSELWTVVRRGGEPQRRHVASEDTPFAITTPMFHLDDGALLHTISTMFLVDSADGLGLLDTDGSIRKIMPGKTDDAFPMPVATDTIRSGEYTLVTGYSAQRLALGHLKDPLVFELVVETGETIPLGARSLADGTLLPVRFTPDGGIIGLQWKRGESHVVIRTGVHETDLAMVPISPVGLCRGPQWADNGVVMVGTTLLIFQPMNPDQTCEPTSWIELTGTG